MEARKEMIINTCLNYLIFLRGGGEVQNAISIAPDFFKQIAISSAVMSNGQVAKQESKF